MSHRLMITKAYEIDTRKYMYSKVLARKRYLEIACLKMPQLRSYHLVWGLLPCSVELQYFFEHQDFDRKMLSAHLNT